MEFTSHNDIKERDILIVAIGTANIGICEAARMTMEESYDMPSLLCRTSYLYIDTDHILPRPVKNRASESVVTLELGNTAGRQDALEFLGFMKQNLQLFKKLKIIPSYVTEDLIKDSDTDQIHKGEASKNPLKGKIYLDANFRKTKRAVGDALRNMTASEKEIIILISPVSGTSAGMWFDIVNLVFHECENINPTLFVNMPSHIDGDKHTRDSTYAIFGWSCRLLERLIGSRLTFDRTFIQVQGSDIRISKNESRRPLVTYITSAYRRKGGEHLATKAEYFDVLSEMLPLFIIGKHKGKSHSVTESKVFDYETDIVKYEQAMKGKEADSNADFSTRRYVSRGYSKVRYRKKLTQKIIRTSLKLQIYDNMLATPQEDDELASKIKEEFAAFFRARVAAFHTDYVAEASLTSLGHKETGDLRSDIDRKKAAFKEKIQEHINNLRDDATLISELFDLIRSMGLRYGVQFFPLILPALRALELDDRFIGNALPGEDKTENLTDRVAELQQTEINMLTAQVRWGSEPAMDTERKYIILVNTACQKIICETLRTDFLSILSDTRDYFLSMLPRFQSSLESARQLHLTFYEKHRPKLENPEGRYIYDMTYLLARQRLERYKSGEHLDQMLPEILQRLDFDRRKPLFEVDRIEKVLDQVLDSLDGLFTLPVDVVDVIRRITDDEALFHKILSKAYALAKINEAGFWSFWTVWSSGKNSTAQEEALTELELKMGQILCNEDTTIQWKNASLPLLDEDDVELVFSETVLNFPITSVETDLPVTEYLALDETIHAGGKSTHRIHTEVVAGSGGNGKSPVSDTDGASLEALAALKPEVR